MKQYLKLLMARECKEVLGRGFCNLWLLSLVLVATFVSIAFSEGSMIYLREKMEDPFTNWVSIKKNVGNDAFNKFYTALSDSTNKEKYGYRDAFTVKYNNLTMMGNDIAHSYYSEGHFFEHLNTPIVRAILDKSNVVEGCTVDSALLVDNTFGFVITLNMANRLGYNKEHLPSYIQFTAYADTAKARMHGLNLKFVDDDKYPISLPVLAVVKRLPAGVDMISANYFYNQYDNDNLHPFSITDNEEYLQNLKYYVSDAVGMERFKSEIAAWVPDSLKGDFDVLQTQELDNMKPWKPGQMVNVYLGNCTDIAVMSDMADKIVQRFDSADVRRVFKLNVDDSHESNINAFLSIEFASLDKIRDFEAFAGGKEYKVNLEMSQVASKENFHAVTIMARILSSAMVVFSVVCIIMFLVNMLQSYFQKVKRNIGTFKAFGMNTDELIQVYLIILISIVLLAVGLSLAVTWTLQCMLPLVGISKEGFNYLSVWNSTTLTAAIVVVVSTVVTVCAVMANMLRQTPGDLIYDRD